MHHLQSIIVKPTGSFCNLQCAYCFYLDKHQLYEGASSTHRMNDYVLEKLICDMFAGSNSPTFTWQGGEPTVMGLNFFQKAVAIQKAVCTQGKSYSNALQTHGILLDESWADFLKRENFLVGISLDGPESVHDRYRKDRQGRGTFQRVVKNARMLLEKEVPVNILVTVNDYSVKYPERIYHFLVDNSFFFMQFNPVVERDSRDPNSAASYSVGAREYGRFLHQLFACWLNDFDWERLRQKTSIRFFDAILQIYVGMMPDHCALHATCNDYLVVEHNGDLFSCDFLVAKDTYLGNLRETTLQQAFQSSAHINFGKQKLAYGIQCRDCQWLRFCHGGCIKDRIRDPRDQGHNHFCESYKYFFNQTHHHFVKLANLYRKYYQ